MTPKYRYYTLKSNIVRFNDSLDEILTLFHSDNTVRVTSFTSCSSNIEYMEQYIYMESALKERFKDKVPAWSLVAQQPLDCACCCEVTEMNNPNFDINYRDYGVEVSNISYKEIIIGGVSGDCLKDNIEEQCNTVFEKIARLLDDNSTSADKIVRQWNYIENITGLEGTKQHYQLFNDARSKLYDKVVWDTGYPAATGIGSSFGGIVIDVNIIASKNTNIYRLDNPLQVAAHLYSQDVLIGEASYGFKKTSTPKFERAKVVECNDNTLLYISGTAAIRGEDSMLIQCATEQAVITMENINHLISISNQTKYNVYIPREVVFQTLRIYIKNIEDYNTVEKCMNEGYPNSEKLFLHCDVCRDELLVEIEGIATTN